MLELLRIRNFAVIEKQEIEFAPGLNVITGETGAGKSILLQALSLILGARPKAKYVRKGADTWEIEAAFNLHQLRNTDFEALPEIAKNENKELILYRSAGESKSKVLINGHLGSVGLLQEITQRIINICGQGEFVSLLDARYHLNLLDEFAAHKELLELVYNHYQTWHAADRDLKQLEKLKAQAEDRRYELESIIEDLSGVEWRSGLRQELEGRLNRLHNSEALITSIKDILSNLERDQGLNDQLRLIQADLQGLLRKDPTLAAGLEKLQSVKAELEDFSYYIENYLDGLDLNESELDRLREQLAKIAALERKYRKNDQQLSELLATSSAEIKKLDDLPDQSKLEKIALQAFSDLQLACDRLTKSRKNAAQQLSRLVSAELKELSMPETTIMVNFENLTPNEHGQDRVEFLASLNRGQDLQPLRLIASGGELSRILLVMKKLLKDRTGVNVLVFDEVDSGVSGKVARSVGEKLKSLAKNSQVLCITHLPQVASLADYHLAVQKIAKDGRTVVKALSIESERVEEIAKLLAGHEITPAVLQSARELLG